MTAFRILDQSPVFFDLQGRLAAGGRLEFYAAGTTTPKDVYGDQDLSVNNGSTIAIGSDGRAAKDLWGDGVYRVRVYAADDTLIADDDDVSIPGGAAATIPALQSGKFLTNDGAVLQWLTVLQPPDPTGQSGKVVGSDGAQLVWQAAPEAPTLPPLPTGGITASSASQKLVIGDVMILYGSDTAPASGTHTTTKTVNFSPDFGGTPKVFVNHKNMATASGFMGTSSARGVSAASFAASFDINTDNSSSAFNITGGIDFDWVAIGPAP